MPRKTQYVVGLDVGTTKTCTVICEVEEEGALEVVGVGSADSKGLRKGVVVNLDGAVSAIKKSVEEAERAAGTPVESVLVGLSGGHIKSFNSQGAVAVVADNREIGKEDIRRVIETAKAVSLPSDREIVHVLPQEFVVDGQGGIGDPLGLLGTRLEVNCHIVTSSTTAAQNIVTAVNRSGLIVADTILQQLASAESTLSNDDKELGVAMIDIGGGTTDLAIYTQGILRHTAILPLGGDQITNDIAVGLRTSILESEKIKRQHGCAYSALVKDDVSFEVSGVGGRQARSISKGILSEIIQPRMEEIITLIQEEIKQAGFKKQAGFEKLGAGVVITGGTALLEGVVDLAETVFELPVRQGNPSGLQEMEAALATPTFSTSVGLVLYGYRAHVHDLRGRSTDRRRLGRWLSSPWAWIRGKS